MRRFSLVAVVYTLVEEEKEICTWFAIRFQGVSQGALAVVAPDAVFQ